MANFCSECGKTISGKFCSNCGIEQQQESYKSANTQYEEQSSDQDVHFKRNSARAVLNTNNEINSTIKIMGIQCRISIIIRTIAVILSVFYFLPYFSIITRATNLSSRVISHHHPNTYTTYELMTELKYNSSSILSGSIFALLLILIPVALFAIYNFYRYIQFLKGNLFVASIILSFAGLLMNFVYAMIITSSVSELSIRYHQGLIGSHLTLTTSFTLYFYLALILYVLCIIVSSKRIKKKVVKAPSL